MSIIGIGSVGIGSVGIGSVGNGQGVAAVAAVAAVVQFVEQLVIQFVVFEKLCVEDETLLSQVIFSAPLTLPVVTGLLPLLALACIYPRHGLGRGVPVVIGRHEIWVF